MNNYSESKDFGYETEMPDTIETSVKPFGTLCEMVMTDGMQTHMIIMLKNKINFETYLNNDTEIKETGH